MQSLLMVSSHKSLRRMEPNSCEMFVNFSLHLVDALPGFIEDNELVIRFKKLLLQNKVEKQPNARRRRICSFRFMGEMYKKKMLTDRIMHECIMKLLYQDPDVGVEHLCELMSTIGEMRLTNPKTRKIWIYILKV